MNEWRAHRSELLPFKIDLASAVDVPFRSLSKSRSTFEQLFDLKVSAEKHRSLIILELVAIFPVLHKLQSRSSLNSAVSS